MPCGTDDHEDHQSGTGTAPSATWNQSYWSSRHSLSVTNSWDLPPYRRIMFAKACNKFLTLDMLKGLQILGSIFDCLDISGGNTSFCWSITVLLMLPRTFGDYLWLKAHTRKNSTIHLAYGSIPPQHAAVWSCPMDFPLLELGWIQVMSGGRFACKLFRTTLYSKLHNLPPVPPFQEVLYFTSLSNIIKKVEKAKVKGFGIRYSVWARECACRRQSKASLQCRLIIIRI